MELHILADGLTEIAYYFIPIILITSVYVVIQKLEKEIAERINAEAKLQELNDKLEARVFSRTQELSVANRSLKLELIIRRQAEQALYDALQKLNSHVENSPLAVIEWDQNFQVSRWSTSAAKLFGWSAEEVFGKVPTEWNFVFEDDLILVKTSMAELARGTTRQLTLTNRNYRNDRTVICCEWYNSVLLDSNGQMESILSLVMDVTDRYRIEQMKSEFISVVSHELRTPLTAIHGSLRMLASGLLDQQPTKQQRLLSIASESADRLVRLINDILDIERIESGKICLIKQQCWIPDLLTAAIDTVYSLSEEAHVTIEVESIDQWIEVDRDRIIQTLTNLLANAIKFSQAGQQIDLKVAQEDVWVTFRVCDRGRGIPADKLECIFDRFQQVDSSDARNHDGTGLGLAICRSIVQQHSGEIWVQSTRGEGSIFSFTLPIQSTVAINQVADVLEASVEKTPIFISNNNSKIEQEKKLKQQSAPQLPPIEASCILQCEKSEISSIATYSLNNSFNKNELRENIKVLLVEDDNDLAEVLTASLDCYQHITIVHARTGSQAIQMTQEVIPNLVILDLNLPDRDGFAVVDWLRQHQKLKHISLMIYSARDLDLAEQQQLKLGKTDFVTKSRVSPHEFEKRIMALLQKT